jgi:hypothetical protein
MLYSCPCSGSPLCAVTLRKEFQYLNADFLGHRAFDAPHPIPKPDQFALFLGIHVAYL